MLHADWCLGSQCIMHACILAQRSLTGTFMHAQERLHKALVVNAPPFFNLLWRIVQPLIPASTKERLFVLRNMQVRLRVQLE